MLELLYLNGIFEAATAKEVEEAGTRTPTFREAEMSRFACLQAKLWLL